MELASALQHPQPQQYISHLAVYQDGSCNGLQHYAALGRDVIGAEQVGEFVKKIQILCTLESNVSF